jgi:uncharacterized repeat protein (TIGR01451 family)
MKKHSKISWTTLFTLLVVMMFMMTLSPSVALAEEPNDGVHDYTFYAYKFASKHTLGEGESLTFTILLYNSSVDTISVDVIDTLPAELTYVADSVSDDGVYDAGSHTITWADLEEMPYVSQLLLTFKVESASEISESVEVTNQANVTTSEGHDYDIEASVTLIPGSPRDDVEFPVVESIIIDEMDILTNPDVTLHIQASDNIGVEKMKIKEWQVGGDPQQGWVETKTSGWVPFSETYEWTLGAKPGVKFIGVWVADAAENVSHATQEAFDFASYLKPDTTFGVEKDESGMVPYLVYYDEGEKVEAFLDWTSSDDDSAFLVYWEPGQYETAVPSENDEIIIEATDDGIYVFGVFFTATEPTGLVYNLDISPGGGPSAWPIVTESVAVGDLEGDGEYQNPFLDFVDPISIALESQPTELPGLYFYLPILLWK